MNKEMKSVMNMRKPIIGEKIKPVRAERAIGLRKRDVHTVTDVKRPTYADDEPIANDGGWLVRTDKFGEVWYAIIHFRYLEEPTQ